MEHLANLQGIYSPANEYKHMYTCLFMQLSDQLIIWQKLIAMQNLQVQIEHQNGRKCHLCDFDHGMVVSSKQAGLNISVLTIS